MKAMIRKSREQRAVAGGTKGTTTPMAAADRDEDHHDLLNDIAGKGITKLASTVNTHLPAC
jgi:hypothetical protein